MVVLPLPTNTGGQFTGLSPGFPFGFSWHRVFRGLIGYRLSVVPVGRVPIKGCLRGKLDVVADRL